MYVIAERHEAVLVNAGSYDISPKSLSEALICRRSIARIVPSVTSRSYIWPVRLSVIVSVSSRAAVTVPSPYCCVCRSVALASPLRSVSNQPQFSHRRPAGSHFWEASRTVDAQPAVASERKRGALTLFEGVQ